MSALVPVALEDRIHLIRGTRVMLDEDLAQVYGVTTKRLNEQVKRNRERFPKGFMFQLTAAEVGSLRSQIATTKTGRGGRRTRPTAFTEHGAVMLASVLNSPTAVAASILVVRAFIRLRELVAVHRDLAKRLDDLERKYDAKFRVVFDSIRALMEPPPQKPVRPKPRIGFLAEGQKR
jgi:hypothetical protein